MSIAICLLMITSISGPITQNVGQSSSTLGGTIYVDDDNMSGIEDGTIAHPYNTIQEGVNHAISGDKVFVFNGTYYENIIIDKSLKLQGEDRNITIIEGEKSKNVVEITASNVEFKRFKVRSNGTNRHDSGIKITSNHNFVSEVNLEVTYRGIYVNSDNNLVRDILCENNDNYGIYITGDWNRIINCSTINTGTFGIFINRGDHNKIQDSYSTLNHLGFQIMHGRFNKIENCTAYNNNNGIRFHAEVYNCCIVESSCINNGKGILFEMDVDNNTITGCLIENNGFGIWVREYIVYNINYPSVNNLIYHNILLGNTISAYDSYSNNWDNGYPVGGNYWCDYSGVDVFNGPDQNILGSDGIGDTPYTFTNGQDNYPLMNPITNGNIKPVADAGSDQTVYIGEIVQFNGSGSYDPDGTINFYLWDFGDRTPQEIGLSPSHIFNNSGNFTVILEVTDNNCSTDTDTCIINVLEEDSLPIAHAGLDQTVNEGDSVQFDGTASYDPDGTIVSYEWDFGDVSPIGTGVNPTHIYNTHGNYTVTLTVTDDDGATGTDICIITVLAVNLTPIANAGPDQTVNEGDLVQFKGCGSYDKDGSYSVKVKRNYPLTSDDYNQYYPSFHPDGTKIMYVSNEDGDPFWDIWIMDDDGNNRTQLTFEDHGQLCPTFNSDGSKIIYASGEDGGISSDIWIMDADGSDHKQITFENFTQLHPIFSPDDSKIAYISEEVNGTFNVWIMDADGTNQMQLTNDTFFDFIYGDSYTILYIARNPIFTPDGNKIIYESTKDGVSISDLWIMDLDGTNHTRLTFENYSQIMPYINQCGNLITYSSNEGPNGKHCLWLMDEKGNNHQQLTNDSYFSTYPRFSPDGTKIVYWSSNVPLSPGNLWMLELDIDNNELKYYWDFDANADSDSDGNFTNDIDATGPTPTHIYGDDGVYIVTLRVTDNDNLSATDTCNVTVQNVNPIVSIESITMEVEIGLRVAGRKYNNVSMRLYEDGNQIGYVSIERMPGSPDEQMAWIPVSINFSKSYNATVIYTPDDPPNIGGNPVWIYIKSQNGSIKKIHHTFNVQQSKKRDSEHWNHVEPWEVDLSGHFIGLPFEITSHLIDPGSDDHYLSYTYGSQVVNNTYLNNPPNPDPYPSPEVNPVDITDTTTLIYEGPGTVTLVVKDDDNIRLGVGEGTDLKSVG